MLPILGREGVDDVLEGDIDPMNGFNDTIFGFGGDDTLTGGWGSDSLVGGRGDDVLFAGLGFGRSTFGSDTLEGGDDDDVLVGFGSRALMRGGRGDDRYFTDGSDRIRESANEGDDHVYAYLDAYNLGSNVEDLSLFGRSGSVQTLSGVGNELDNRIEVAFNRAAALEGLRGDDTLVGSREDDTLRGGRGADSLIGGAGDDSLFGGRGEDTLRAGAGNDDLFGGAGEDMLIGGSGLNRMFGGDGDDIYIVEQIFDQPRETAGGGVDTTIANRTWFMSPNVENLQLIGEGDFSGFGNDEDNEILGNQGDNWLSGRGGEDTLYGAAGDDTLSGGDGADELFGGAGSDVFIYFDEDVGSEADLIVDFDRHGRLGDDRISLRNVDADPGRAGLQSFDFAASPDEAGAGRVWFTENGDGRTRLIAMTSTDSIEIVIADGGGTLASFYNETHLLL